MVEMDSEHDIWWKRTKVPVSGSLFAESILKPDHPEEMRIQRLRQHILTQKNGKNTPISIERARLITESYRLTEGEPSMIRRAKAIANIFSKIPISIHEDELLVGHPCSSQGVIEIDPEFQSTWLLDKITFDGKEMTEFEALFLRDREPCSIDPADLRELIEDILPYWKDRTHQTYVMKELERNYPDAIQYYRSSEAFLPLFGAGVCHTIQDYLSVLRQGLHGLKLEILERMKALDPISPRRTDHYDLVNTYRAMMIVAEASIEHSERYATLSCELAEKEPSRERADELRDISEICQKVPANPAGSFWEALQSLHLMHLLTFLAESGASHSPGRLDQYLLPYLKRDLEEGRISLEKAQVLLEHFFIKCHERVNLLSYEAAEGRAGVRANDNITIGGLDSEGRDATNLMSHMALEAYVHVHLGDPPLSVRVHRNTPDAFLRKTLEALRLGGGMPKIINDEILIPGFLANRVSLRDARNYADLGCQENVVDPNCGDRSDANGRTNAGYLNLLKPIELAIFNGTNPENGVQLGPKTADPETFGSVEDFFEAVRQQLDAENRANVVINNVIEYCFWKHTPSPFHNLMHPGPRASGIDYSQGGCRYNWTGATGVGLANAADSLAVIDRLIYRTGAISWKDLRTALRNNWAGFESLRQRCIGVPKYGMDEELPDGWAKRYSDIFFDTYESHPTPRGGHFVCGFYSMGTYVTLGKHTGATPDGRARASPWLTG